MLPALTVAPTLLDRADKVDRSGHRKQPLANDGMIAVLRGKGLRIEKRLVNTKRIEVRAFENEWDFD